MDNQNDESMDALRALYDAIYTDNFFIKEFEGLAGVGDLRDLKVLAEAAGLDLVQAVERLGLGETVDLTAPGRGTTRVERVTDAWNAAKLCRKRQEFPRTIAARRALGLSVDDQKALGTF